MQRVSAVLGVIVGCVVLGVTPGASAQDWGPSAGDWDFTIGGSGSNDNDFDVGSFGFSTTIGRFLTDHSEIGLRQSLNLIDGDEDNDIFGSTRLFYDYHFDLERFRPFLGLNAGGLYGDVVEETFSAGLEGGIKFYVKEETYIVVSVEYGWLFEDLDDADDTFDDGIYTYFLGVGFNF